jgi:predicted MFS family arabinose efflux permease
MALNIKDSTIDEGAIKPFDRRFIFTLLFFLYFFNILDRFLLSSMFPLISREWGLTDTQCGMLVSTIYWAIVISVLPLSIVVDRWSRRKAIGLMAVFWSFMAIASAFASSFTELFTFRALLGVGVAAFAPGGLALLSGLYPIQKRARILGFWQMSIPFGTAVGVALGGVVAATLGWRYAFGLIAAPGLIFALLFFFIKDYKTVALEKTTGVDGSGSQRVKMEKRDIVMQFLRTPTLILTYLGFTCSMFTTTALITWLPTYFQRSYNVPVDRASILAGAVLLLAIVGAPAGGLLSDFWIKKKINSRLMVAGFSTLVSTIILVVALVFFTHNTTFQYVLWLVMGISTAMFGPAVMAVTQEVVHPGLRSMSFAIAQIISFLLGASLGPMVVGALSDASDIGTAFLVLPGATLVATALFFIGSIFYERDFHKVEKVEMSVN